MSTFLFGVGFKMVGFFPERLGKKPGNFGFFPEGRKNCAFLGKIEFLIIVFGNENKFTKFTLLHTFLQLYSK